MKNLKYVMMMALAITVGLSSCSSDDEGGNSGKSEPKSVFLKITNDPATYGEGAAVANNTTVNFSSGEVFFVNGSGAILDHYKITTTTTNLPNKEISVNDISKDGVNLQNMNGGITDIHIVGNVPASMTLPTIGNISGVINKTLGIDTQSDITKVNLYGTSALSLTAGSGNKYTANVTLKPTVARIELSNIKAGGIIKSFQVDGIFIDNYYSKGNFGGIVAAENLINNGVAADSFKGGSTAYPSGLNKVIYDWYGSGLVANDNLVVEPASNHVWGYNLFATVDGSDVPRIIIRMSNFTTNNNSTISNPQFVTIKGMKSSGQPLSGIKAGNIYNIAANALIIDETTVTPKPNQNAIDINVEVTLTNWKAVAVNPDL